MLGLHGPIMVSWIAIILGWDQHNANNGQGHVKVIRVWIVGLSSNLVYVITIECQ